jgi:predicted nucleic acid-binding protein
VILADTSVWVDHLRVGNRTLAELLDLGLVLAHPFVIGELALGRLHQREIILEALSQLPRSVVATDAEVLKFIDGYALFGRGIGYVDVHLLAAVRLTAGSKLWMHDQRLLGAAEAMGGNGLGLYNCEA